MTPTPSTFSQVLPYKWEAYCRTNGGCTVGETLSPRLGSQEGTAIQMGGGGLPYKLKVSKTLFWGDSLLGMKTIPN